MHFILLLLVTCLVQAITNIPTNLVVPHDKTVSQSIESSSLTEGYVTNDMHNDAVKRITDEIKSRQSGQHVGTHSLISCNPIN